MALLNPTGNTKESGKRYVIAVDNSASMSSNDDGQVRLDAAKQKAVEFIDSLSGSDDLQVLAFMTDGPIPPQFRDAPLRFPDSSA